MTRRKFSSVLKIITVDDSSIVTERLQSLFSELDYVAFMGNARSIGDALHLIEYHRPDVVILDIHLEGEVPGANGITLLTRIKRIYPNMYIVMLTNMAIPQYRSVCMALGADYFLDKSHDFELIPETLKKINYGRTA
jgi:DNA-binding NarL/FixJ family response regulator